MNEMSTLVLEERMKRTNEFIFSSVSHPHDTPNMKWGYDSPVVKV